MMVPSANGSRQVATSTRATSSAQYPSSTRGVEWSACSNVPIASLIAARCRKLGSGAFTC